MPFKIKKLLVQFPDPEKKNQTKPKQYTYQ